MTLDKKFRKSFPRGNAISKPGFPYSDHDSPKRHCGWELFTIAFQQPPPKYFR